MCVYIYIYTLYIYIYIYTQYIKLVKFMTISQQIYLAVIMTISHNSKYYFIQTNNLFYPTK